MKTYLKPIVIATSLMMGGAYASQSIFLNPVVVTGENSPSITQPSINQARAKVKEIPGGASIVDMENVREGRTSTWVDMLGMAPGVFVQERFGSEEARISVRGSALSRTFHSFGLKIMQDGIPINYADGFFDMQTVDPMAARYVEVLRGANAISYGGSTLGGAINLISPTGYDKKNTARLEAGSFEYRRVHAQTGDVYQARDGKAFDYNISLGMNAQHGFREWAHQESQKLVANWGLRVNQNLESRFYFSAVNSLSHLPGNLTLDQLRANPRQANVANISLRTSRDLDAYRIANKTTLRDGRNTYEIALYALQQDLYHPTSMSHIEQVANTYGGHIKWLQSNELFGLPNQMQIAFMPSTGKTKSNSWSYVSVSAPFNPAKSSQTGRALQDSDNQSWLVENRTKVNSNTSIVSSLQYEYARRKITDPLATSSNYDRTYDAWLPRLGFTHDISSQQQIFGNISRNFEAPIFGVASDMQASQAQTGTTYELGARGDARYKEINSLIGWDITVYRADLRNEFQTTCSSTVSCSGGAITRNIPRTLHQGVEAGIYSLTKNHYETRTSLLISDFRFQDNALYGDNRMPGFPPLLLRSEFLYRWGPSFGVTGLPANYLGPKIEWASKAPIDNRNTQHNEAYFLLGFKAGQQLDRSWSWFLDGRNLTDKKYAATTGVYATNLSASTAAYLPGDGRSFYFGLEKKWD